MEPYRGAVGINFPRKIERYSTDRSGGHYRFEDLVVAHIHEPDAVVSHAITPCEPLILTGHASTFHFAAAMPAPEVASGKKGERRGRPAESVVTNRAISGLEGVLVFSTVCGQPFK